MDQYFCHLLIFRDTIHRDIIQQMYWFPKNDSDSQNIQGLSRFHSGKYFPLGEIADIINSGKHEISVDFLFGKISQG